MSNERTDNTCPTGADRPIVEGNKYPSGHRVGNIYNVGGVSPTVMDNHGENISVKDPCCLTPRRTDEAKRIRKQYDNHEIKRQRKYMQQLEPRTDGVTNTLTGVQKDNLCAESAESIPFRIRRLTPRECFRLMDVDEDNIDRIQSHTFVDRVTKDGEVRYKTISESQQYKLAGNSIVVACLYYIFRNLFITPVSKPIDTEPKQLNIFDIL